MKCHIHAPACLLFRQVYGGPALVGAPPPSLLPAGLHGLLPAVVVGDAAVHRVAPRDARRDEGSELHDVRSGELEGVEVGLQHLAGAVHLAHGPQDRVVRGAACRINKTVYRVTILV